MEQEELMHYRTKGSKNGERRYQYKDGTLTPLGRIHYGIGLGENADNKHNKEVRTKTTATEGKSSDSFINSIKGNKSNSLSKDEKKVQKALEKSMKKAVKEKKELEAEEAKKKAEEAKKKLEESKKEESKKDSEEPKKDSEEPKKDSEEPKKNEPKKDSEEPEKEESETTKLDKNENVKNLSDKELAKRNIRIANEKKYQQWLDEDANKAREEANKAREEAKAKIESKAKVADAASTVANKAKDLTKAIGSADNEKRMTREISEMDTATLKKVTERIRAENDYKTVNKDRMTKGYDFIYKTLNIAAPALAVTGSVLRLVKEFQDVKK